MDRLHRIFDDKYERRIAQGILELLDDQEKGKCNGVFYKTADNNFRRHIEGSTGRPLTVAYNGQAKNVISQLIDNGAISVSEISVEHEGQRGYKLIRSF